MLWGRYASRRSEARFPTLWDGRLGSWCPSIQGPSGLRLWDTSGRGCHGTLTNMDAPTDWVRNAGSYALDFDGVDDRVQMTGSGPTTSCRTMSIWMRYPGPGTGFRIAIDYGALATGQRLLIGWNGQNIIMDRFGGGLSVSGYYDFAWHNAVVVDRVGAYELWVDGKLGASGTQPSTPTAGPIRLGIAIDGSPFPGQIDDAITYGRALSGDEIRTLARRRGISYELRRDIVFGSTGNRLRRLICGANC